MINSGTVNNKSEASYKKLGIALALLSAIGAWLALPPGYLGVPEFREWIGLTRESVPLKRADKSNPGKIRDSAVPPSSKRPDEGSREKSTLPYIGGFWVSHSDPGYNYVFSQDGDRFDIYVDLPQGQAKIGSGRIHGTAVVATVRTVVEKRWAEIELQLSQDGQQLSGHFSGVARQEKNLPLRLTRPTMSH
jgi:hypothetical protein